MSVDRRGVAALLMASTRQTPRRHLTYLENEDDPEGTESLFQYFNLMRIFFQNKKTVKQSLIL